MRRLALFSDIHGNLVALNAVLEDIEREGLTDVYCLGDLVGYGPDPAGVIDRIRGLSIPTIRGNYDDGIGNRRGQCGCYYATEQARSDGAASYTFTDGTLDDIDHRWLAALPDEVRLQVEGVRVLLAHGSPRKINEYLLLDRQDKQLARLAEEADADLVCVGHVHIPYHRSMLASDGNRIHYVSTGSVGKPRDGDPRAGWVELVIGDEAEVRRHAPGDEAASAAGASVSWTGIVVHRIAYDISSTVDAMRTAGLPETLIEALQAG